VKIAVTSPMKRRRTGARGGKKLAKYTRPGDTWISVRVSRSMRDTIARVATSEHRSSSNMALVLFEEALRARGIVVSTPDEQETPDAED